MAQDSKSGFRKINQDVELQNTRDLIVGGDVTANAFIGDGSQLTGVATAAPNDALITLTAGGGLTGGGGFTVDQASDEIITISHSDTSSQASVNNSGLTVIQDITLDTYGHITAIGSTDISTAGIYVKTTAETGTGVKIGLGGTTYQTLQFFANNGISVVRNDNEIVISAPDYADWNAAYNYSTVGHLPLTGGTLSSDLTINKENATATLVISRGGTDLPVSTNIGTIDFYADYAGTPTQYAGIKAYSNNLSGVRSSLDLNVKSTSGNILTGLTVYGTSSGVNVGIGTANPSQKLSLRNSGNTYLSIDTNFAAANAGILLSESSTPTTNGAELVYDGSTNKFHIKTGTASFTERFTIERDSGKVGIGTTSPDTILHVNGGTAADTAKVTIGGNDAIIRLGDNQAGGPHGLQFDGEVAVDGMSMYYRTTPQQISFEDSTGVSGSKIMVIGRNGNVGIGETTPLVPLHISRNTASGENIALILDNNDSTANSEIAMLFRSYVGSTNTDFQIATVNTGANAAQLVFRSDGTVERMRITNTGNVGIGTTSPIAKLTLPLEEETNYKIAFKSAGTTHAGISTVDQSGAGLYIGANSFVNAGGVVTYSDSAYPSSGIYFDGWNEDAIKFYEASSGAPIERMRIANGGSVGIGTTSPAGYASKILDIGGAASVSLNFHTTNSGATANDGATLYYGSDNSLRFVNYETDGIIRFDTQDTERMRISSSGNVGIGTSNPTQKLTLQNGTFQITGASTFSGNVEIGRVGSDNNMGFATGGTERMRIDTSGNVGIGTASKLNAYSTSFRTLSIHTPAGDYAAILELAGNRSAGAGNQNGMIQFWNKTSTATETARISGNQSSAVNSGNITFLTASSGTLAERMRLNSDGTLLVKATTSAYGEALGYTLGVRGVSSQAFISVARGNQTLDSEGLIVGLDTSTGYVWLRDNIPLSFGNNNSAKMTILANGNVGIGTTSPVTNTSYSKVLHINSASGLGTVLKLTDQTTGDAAADGFELLQYGLNSYLLNRENGSMFFYTNNDPKMVILPGGNVGIGTTSPSYKLDVAGNARITSNLDVNSYVSAGAFLNTNDHFEKLLSASFPDGQANLAVDIRLGNLSFWGYIEVEITGTYSNQNTPGKLTKVFAVGTNPGNNIYANESRVVDAMGPIVDNISLGSFEWDGAQSLYRIPISHIVSTGNNYTVKVRMFTHGSGAVGVFNNLSISPTYNRTAFARNYVHYNDRLGIGIVSPAYQLDVNGTSRFNGNTALITDASSGNYSLIQHNYNGSAKAFSGYNSGFALYGGETGVSTRLQAGGQYALTLLTNGNVGIGTTDPVKKIDVLQPSDSSYAINIKNPSGRYAYVGYSDTYQLDFGATGSNDNVRYGVFTSGGGTASFYTGGSPRMFINSSGNVGIGTTSPGYKLDVSGDARATGNLISDFRLMLPNMTLGYWDSTYNRIESGSSRPLFITAYAQPIYMGRNGSIGDFTLNTNGYIGIGTTSPGNKLHVAGGGILIDNNQDYRIKNSSGVQRTLIYMNSSNKVFLVNDDGDIILSSIGNVGIGTTSPNEKIQVAGNIHAYAPGEIDTALFASTSAGSTSVAIRSSGITHFNGGNVGIGTSNPTQKLTLQNGTFQITGASTFSGNVEIGRVGSDNNMGFATGGTERMRIDSSGQVKITSTGSASNDDTAIKFDINSTNHIKQRITTSSTGGYQASLELESQGNAVSIATAGSNEMRFNTAGSERMRIDSSGNLLVGLTTGAKFSVSYGGNDTHFGLGGNYDNYITAGSGGATIFRNSTTERMRLNSDGTFLVKATTSAYGETLGYTLGVRGVSSQAFISVARGNQTLDSEGLIVGLDTGTGYVWLRDNIPLSFGNNNSAKMTILANGNVGIGRTDPSYKLDVSGQIRVDNGVGNGAGQALVVGGSGDVTLTDGGSLFFGAYSYAGSTYIRGFDGGNVMYFYSNGTNTAYFKNDRAIFNTAVGIGTTDPSAKIDVRRPWSNVEHALIAANSSNSINMGTYDTAIIQADDVTTLRIVERNPSTTDQVMTLAIGDNVGRISITGQPLQFYVNGSPTAYGYTGLNGTLALALETSGKAYFTNNLGIGTTSPSFKLSVNTNGDIYSADFYQSNSGTDQYNAVRVRGAMTSAVGYYGIGGSTVGNGTFRDAFVVGTQSAHSFNLATNDTARITILSGGNVGIGTNPSRKLDVNGVIGAINSGVDGTFADAFVGVYAPNNNEQNAIQTSVSSVASISGFRFQASNGGGSAGRTTVVDFKRDRQIFYTDVGIGVTGPSEKLEVNGNIKGGYGIFNGEGLSQILRVGGIYGNLGLYIPGTYDMQFDLGWGGNFKFTIGNSTKTIINSAGTLTATGDVLAYSDARVKENIETIDNALDKVMSMRGVSYNRTDSDDKAKKIGVIAQEIQQVLPEVVQEQEDGMLSVSYGNIVGVLIEAMKEQQKQIDELKAIINGSTK